MIENIIQLNNYDYCREIIQNNGFIGKFYYRKNEDNNICRHRLDGPAIYTLIDNKIYFPEWWVNGTSIKVSSQKEFEKFLQLKVFI